MFLNSESIQELLKVTREKADAWTEQFSQLQFDKFGRAKVGEIETLTVDNARQYFTGTKGSWDDSFNDYLKSEGKVIKDKYGSYQRRLNDCYDISLSDLVSNTFHFINIETDKRIKMKASKVLAKVQEIWLKTHPNYIRTCSEIKERRGQGEDFSTSEALVNLNYRKEEYEYGNMYFQHQKFSNDCKGMADVILTVNPLDLLVASGATGEGNPTKFSTCWSTRVEVSEDRVDVFSAGCYSKPEAQIALGSIINRGMVYIANGITTTIPDTDYRFIGYKERISLWMDMNGIWAEIAYPSKSNLVKKNFLNILTAKGLNTLEHDFGDEYDYIPFEIQDEHNIQKYLEFSGLFLDKVCINDADELCFMRDSRVDYDYNNPDRMPEMDNKAECSCCGDRHVIDNMTEIDGEWYCNYCRDENFVICEHCGSYINFDDAISIGDFYYDERCAEEVGFQCDECGKWHYDRDRINAYKSGEEVCICYDCRDSYYESCDKCGEIIYKDDCTYINDEYVCDDCKEQYYEECVDCGETFCMDDLNDDLRCVNCQEELDNKEIDDEIA